MDRLEEIKKKKGTWLTYDEKDWLVSEIKRYREVIVNELNRLKYYIDSDSVKAQQILLKALKER